MMLPTPATPMNCASTSGGKPTAAKDARIPELTPSIPSAFPCLAVAWEASPDIEPIFRGESSFVAKGTSRLGDMTLTDTQNTASEVAGLY